MGTESASVKNTVPNILKATADNIRVDKPHKQDRAVICSEDKDRNWSPLLLRKKGGKSPQNLIPLQASQLSNDSVKMINTTFERKEI